MAGSNLPAITVVGIDPGALAGVAVIRLCGYPRAPRILDARIVESEGVIRDPLSPGLKIAALAIQLAGFHEADFLAIELPMLAGARQFARMKTYAAQRELIGAIRSQIIGHQMREQVIEPGQAKKALVDDRLATKRQMLLAVRNLIGWQKTLHSRMAAMEAMVDAVAIGIAGANLASRQMQEV